MGFHRRSFWSGGAPLGIFVVSLAVSCMSSGGKLSDDECAAVAKHAAEVMAQPEMEAGALEACKSSTEEEEWAGFRCIGKASTKEEIDACVDTVEQGDPARTRDAQRQANVLKEAIELYRTQKKGACPDTLNKLKAAGIQDVEKDPWGNDFDFKCTEDPAISNVTSPGPDGTLGTADDVRSN